MALLMLLLLFTHSAFGFILSDPCPTSSPCRCYGSTINCAYQRINVFPTFTFNAVSDYRNRDLEINLGQNHLTSIPANAFGKIKDVNPGHLDLSLDKNNISVIDDQAFSNLGTATVTLDLSENNLHRLPNALASIQNLKTLRLLHNSMLYLDGSILTALGKSLQYLWIDMSSVPIWPREFNTFGVLRELLIDQLPFESIPHNSFEGMTSLFRLEITDSKLNAVPEAICSLGKLGQLDFNHNTNLMASRKELLSTCPHPLTAVTLVYLNNNNMYSFPNNLFNVFPRLLTLGLNFNNIEGIDASLIPSDSPLYYLYMSDNKLTQIPPAVSKFKGLLTLVVSDNMITSVNGEVLSSLNVLRQLTISNNPLTYIDPHAFNTNYTMANYYMENTNLTSVPVAILHSADRFSIQLLGSPLQCTCSNMAFLHAIPTSEVQSGKKFFRGRCVNINKDLKSYIVDDLPSCL